MPRLDPVGRRWPGKRCFVAGTGPSLTEDVAARLRGERVIAVNDAYRLLPRASVLYACDAPWWDVHEGAPGFAGERWSSHSSNKDPECFDLNDNDKIAAGEAYGLRLVHGRTEPGFSLDPAFIHYGDNSGFQAINLAIHFGAEPICLVGFNMSGGHFFGPHPEPLTNTLDYRGHISAFDQAAAMLNGSGPKIVNCTDGSLLTCFERMDLNDVVSADAGH